MVTDVAIATDSAPEDWAGERGDVNAEMIEKYVPDLSLPIYYLSGPRGMVGAMRKLLIDLEINEDNIRTEEFNGYGDAAELNAKRPEHAKQ